ncbi:hypothetical protein BC829DRAFT_398477 [Chytridium lagenaria]|nr:hypothetical protein BC829DRAFT_398477 [Chytridium lagenaria]
MYAFSFVVVLPLVFFFVEGYDVITCFFYVETRLDQKVFFIFLCEIHLFFCPPFSWCVCECCCSLFFFKKHGFQFFELEFFLLVFLFSLPLSLNLIFIFRFNVIVLCFCVCEVVLFCLRVVGEID